MDNMKNDSTVFTVELTTDDEISTSQEMENISQQSFESLFKHAVKDQDDSELHEVMHGIHFAVCGICSKPFTKENLLADQLGSLCDVCLANIQKPAVADMTQVEFVQQSQVSVEQHNTFLSATNDVLPSSSTDGLPRCNFDIIFTSTEKGRTDAYNQALGKLFVTRNKPFAVNFVTKSAVPSGSKIRVFVMFAEAEHLQEVVSRCRFHKETDQNNGIDFAEHFVRCTSTNSEYWIDSATGIGLVAVPYEPPQSGSEYSTYVFMLTCFGTCLKKKPIKLVFQLEYNGVVLGEKTVPVKVCATPSRDSRRTPNPKSHNNVPVPRTAMKRKFPIKSEPTDVDASASQLNEAYMKTSNNSVSSTTIASSQSCHQLSSCPPASNTWPGEYEFNVQIVSNHSSHAKYKYSQELDTLFIEKAIPCPVIFRTEQMVPYNTKIRAMVVFSDLKHANDVVFRCSNHMEDDFDKGFHYGRHLIICESNQAQYEENSINHRLSVVLPYVPLINSPAGTTYTFKFLDHSSCPGGINRRPVKVIFTLENGDQVIGRHSLEVKICASPSRDCGNALKKKKKMNSGTTSPAVTVQEPKERGNFFGTFNVMDTTNLETEIDEDEIEDNEGLTITVNDYNLYLFLTKTLARFRQFKNNG